MSLNLISDFWIPVRTTGGTQRVIRPDQIAEPNIVFPDWPRADLNIACLELLIGLVYMADPPDGPEDWEMRTRPDPAHLREQLAKLAPAFHLDGDGPRFLQDLDQLEGEPNPPDMLFIDSAGGNTARNNADLMVRRGRYPALDLPLAAMALYTLQAHAPSGGAGNRTSMRGGGPMVTLVDPGAGLWDLVWANVPDGKPHGPEALPWMRATRVSESKNSEVWPEGSDPAEAFFGMPRRLRLVFEGGAMTGVIQRPYGTNYAGWRHPLTPYYRMKIGAEQLPLHPRAGAFGYRNWLGVVMAAQNGELRQRAVAVETFYQRAAPDQRASVIVAGWAMDNMKPRDFIFSRQPFVTLSDAAALLLRGMVEAAEQFGVALRAALTPVVAEGEAREALREEFFARSEGGFRDGLRALEDGMAQNTVAEAWVKALRGVALELFDARARPGLDRRRMVDVENIVRSRNALLAAFSGKTKVGLAAYGSLSLKPRDKEAAK